MNLTLSELPVIGVFPEVRRRVLSLLQINLGYLCNQQCVHCHVGAGPKRTEIMSRETIETIFDFLRNSRVRRIDLTGGAPEMNPHFRSLVETARSLEIQVSDRSNLTVLELPDYRDLPSFLARNQVEITASLPCYQKDNVDYQRGEGVFDSSLQAMKRLNDLGYAQKGSGLILNLVYNPVNPVLPPPQAELEEEYREVLWKNHGVRFDRLFVLANMPIQRFRAHLVQTGQLKPYMSLLKKSFVRENLDQLMCRDLVSVDWEGYLYDCDFNQMKHFPLGAGGRSPVHISELANLDLEGAPVWTADHCFGCTAGQGSSCGGALTDPSGGNK
ncbi:MAG: arsenosugar biosynthesis radical SAM (seleno)protein ArsS [Leptospirales bacterium]